MKKIIPIMIIAICLLVICYNNLKSGVTRMSDFKGKEVTGNEVLECNADIPEGYYDIKVLQGPTSIGLDVLNKGESYHNYHIRKNSSFFLMEGKGTVKIMAPKRKLLQGSTFDICQMGNYVVGEDISEGKYNVILQSKKEKNNNIGLFLWNSDEDQCLYEYSFKETKDMTYLQLKKGQIMNIYRTSELNDKKSEICLTFERFKQ